MNRQEVIEITKEILELSVTSDMGFRDIVDCVIVELQDKFNMSGYAILKFGRTIANTIDKWWNTNID